MRRTVIAVGGGGPETSSGGLGTKDAGCSVVYGEMGDISVTHGIWLAVDNRGSGVFLDPVALTSEHNQAFTDDCGIIGLKVEVPETSDESGAAGSWAEDGTYLYVYSAALTKWVRAPLELF